jgi:hypothetical protein
MPSNINEIKIEITAIKSRMREIEEQRRELSARKKHLRHIVGSISKTSKHRGMLPDILEIAPDGPGIIPGIRLHAVERPIGAETFRNIVGRPTWRKILNAMSHELGCPYAGITFCSSMKGIRRGMETNVLAFKHRYNEKFNALMGSMRKSGIGLPVFTRLTGIWTLTDTEETRERICAGLPQVFSYLVDIRAARIWSLR